MKFVDISEALSKLTRQESLSQSEVVSILKELEHFRGAFAYLASCQAATLETLPKSTSKCGRARHVSLCEAAAKMLEGDISPIRYPETLDAARRRCLSAAVEFRQS